jgi:hypothetical protein
MKYVVLGYNRIHTARSSSGLESCHPSRFKEVWSEARWATRRLLRDS